ncbi:MAG: peptidoglycan bridge formation glycyltransferase FemA/FemB family protein [Ardenticatenaceae bacterium]|nr:peptidoglycan bridge formation glycyltransferase FemA/FemB family protein [Anaerolineales bacterium]MCB8918224.1 peptidoglycan bridge formation glycyltransferase FemA/FemB family protein [Ardenticatenaceae bacterium]
MFEEIFEIGQQPYTEADAEWDDFVAGHPHGSLLQTTQWAQLKNRFGWHSHRVWLRQDGQLVAGAQVLYRSVAFGAIKMGYIPHGPLVNWNDDEQVAVLLNQLDQSAYQNRAGIMKLEPLLWEDELPPAGWQAITQRHNLRIPSDTIQPPRTILLDLRPAGDDILAAMKQKTRYNIRLAEKKGVTVRQGDLNDMPAFVRLLAETARRDTFSIHDPRYYRSAMELFPEQSALLLAEYEGQPLAGVMVFATGQTAAYLYGASGSAERQRMPAYAAQWAAIQWAKARGCTHYDFWGVPDYPLETLETEFTTRQDGLWPVYRFKRGFGGELRRTVGAADRVYNNLLYRLYRWRRGRR